MKKFNQFIQLDELSKDTLHSYMVKATKEKKAGGKDRTAGVMRAWTKSERKVMEDVEQVDEVSTGKLLDYVAAASQDVGRRIEKAEPGPKPFKKILDRSAKIGRAKAHIQMKTNEDVGLSEAEYGSKFKAAYDVVGKPEDNEARGKSRATQAYKKHYAQLHKDAAQNPESAGTSSTHVAFYRGDKVHKYVHKHGDKEGYSSHKKGDSIAKIARAVKSGNPAYSSKEIHRTAHDIHKHLSTLNEEGDVCPVCGQTPCNCTSIDEGTSRNKIKRTWNRAMTNIRMQNKADGKYVKGTTAAMDDNKKTSNNAHPAGKRDTAADTHNTPAAVKNRAEFKAKYKVTKEEVEQVDELKSSTLKSYIRNSSGDVINQNNIAHNDKSADLARIRKLTTKRNAGQLKAQQKLTKRGLGEEAEQVDELKKSTLGSYVKKASMDASDQAYSAGVRGSEDKHSIVNLRKAEKRQIGVEKAVDRLTKEDVEQVDELRTSTLLRYTTKAGRSADKLGGAAGRAIDSDDRATAAKNFTKRDNRLKGIMKARAKIQAKKK